eukprot:TRINITY_DN4874_c0_g1_i5.p1 TRINITY_DN4874_c0_g1~~TRINITY_DN4874_c0_g1_i5.p1  ORF type:complete len:433 (-),score=73.80 TRINITY_DN4874_c0_g1_i5:188-1486(-)
MKKGYVVLIGSALIAIFLLIVSFTKIDRKSSNDENKLIDTNILRAIWDETHTRILVEFIKDADLGVYQMMVDQRPCEAFQVENNRTVSCQATDRMLTKVWVKVAVMKKDILGSYDHVYETYLQSNMQHRSEKLPCMVLSDTKYCSPYFIIGGPFKGGTTSVFRYLSLHPNVVLPNRVSRVNTHQRNQLFRGKVSKDMRMHPPIGHKNHLKMQAKTPKNRLTSRTRTHSTVADALWKNKIKEVMSFHQKELHFFDKAYSTSERSWPTYLSKFPRLLPGDGLVTGEGTPNYLYVPRVPMTLARFNSQTKVIFLLREPLQRAYSQYCHRMSLIQAKNRVRKRSLVHKDVINKTSVIIALDAKTKEDILSSFVKYISDEKKVLLECISPQRPWPEVHDCILLKHSEKSKEGVEPTSIVDETYLAHSLYEMQVCATL